MLKLKFLVCQLMSVGLLCGCINQSAVLLEPENNAVVNQHNYLQQEIVRRNLSRKELAEFIKSERDLQKIRDFSFGGIPFWYTLRGFLLLPEDLQQQVFWKKYRNNCGPII